MREACIACDLPFVAGDEYLPDYEGGFIHFACCGPEPEGFVDLDTREPLAETPKPSIWEDDKVSALPAHNAGGEG